MGEEGRVFDVRGWDGVGWGRMEGTDVPVGGWVRGVVWLIFGGDVGGVWDGLGWFAYVVGRV